MTTPLNIVRLFAARFRRHRHTQLHQRAQQDRHTQHQSRVRRSRRAARRLSLLIGLCLVALVGFADILVPVPALMADPEPAPARVPAGEFVIINEFMASNGETLADEDGDYEDWIELFNRSTTPVSLYDVGLSDDLDRPFRWSFPDITLEPGEFLLVWASGKDRRDPDAPLHTNFSISSQGEPLLLTHPTAGTLDAVDAVPVPRDISFGRSPDGSEWLYFDEPTPGTPNPESEAGYRTILNPPDFSHSGGFYTQSFDLSLFTDDLDATILYTLDGSEPHPDNLEGATYTYKQQYPRDPGDPVGELFTATLQTLIYANPLTIDDRSEQPDRLTGHATTYARSPAYHTPETPVFKGTTVRARTVKAGALPSPIVTHTYFVTPDGAQLYSLPVISLVTQEDYFFGYETGVYVAGIAFDNWRASNPEMPVAGRRPANYQRANRNWEHPIHMEYFIPDAGLALSQNLGFRIHGGWSRSLPQKSLRIYARSSYDVSDSMDYPFFANLVNRVTHEPITAFRRLILRNSGNDSHYTRYRDAFIHTLLQPLGLDQQAYQPTVHFINGEYWGLINVRERIDRFYIAAHHQIDPDDVAILVDAARLEEGSAQDRQDYIDMRHYVRDHDMADPEHYAFAAARMDMDNFILYQMAQIYAANNDWPNNNVRFWRKRTPDTSHNAPPHT